MPICRKCFTEINFILTTKGKYMPQNLDGTPHWATCPYAKFFKEKKESKKNEK